jgi:hypothetical protein
MNTNISVTKMLLITRITRRRGITGAAGPEGMLLRRSGGMLRRSGGVLLIGSVKPLSSTLKAPRLL